MEPTSWETLSPYFIIACFVIFYGGAALVTLFYWLRHRRCEMYGSQGCEGKVGTVRAMTAYCYDDADRKAGKPDPNRNLTLCEGHAHEYREYWQERWDEYYSGLL